MAVKPEKTVVGGIKDTYQERSGKISMTVYGKKMLFQAEDSARGAYVYITRTQAQKISMHCHAWLKKATKKALCLYAIETGCDYQGILEFGENSEPNLWVSVSDSEEQLEVFLTPNRLEKVLETIDLFVASKEKKHE